MPFTHAFMGSNPVWITNLVDLTNMYLFVFFSLKGVFMVILLTGTTHVGKTYLADYIMKKYHINYFSLDLLKMSFYLTKNTLLTPEDRNDYWTNFLWPYVEQMIHVSIENKFDLVIEGCYIPYDYKKYFNEYELSKIKFLSILFTAEYLEKYFDDVCLYENIIEKRKVKNDISIEGIKRCCGFLYQEVINNEVPCFLYKEKEARPSYYYR